MKKMRNEILSQRILQDFPVRGSTVVGYFVERGSVRGYYYFGVVTASGKKKCRLRFDFLNEDFTELEGTNEYYQLFSILGYVSFLEYEKYWDQDGLVSISKDVVILSEPCEIGMRHFKKQEKQKRELERQYGKKNREYIQDISNGDPIRFCFVRGLQNYDVVETAAFRNKDDDTLYGKVNYKLIGTEEKDDMLRVSKSMLLD